MEIKFSTENDQKKVLGYIFFGFQFFSFALHIFAIIFYKILFPLSTHFLALSYCFAAIMWILIRNMLHDNAMIAILLQHGVFGALAQEKWNDIRERGDTVKSIPRGLSLTKGVLFGTRMTSTRISSRFISSANFFFFFFTQPETVHLLYNCRMGWIWLSWIIQIYKFIL